MLADDARESVVVGRVAGDVKPLAVEVIGAATISFLSDAAAVWLGAFEGGGKLPTTEPEGPRPCRVGIGDGLGGERHAVDPSPVGKRGHLGLGSLETWRRRIEWWCKSGSTGTNSNKEREGGASTEGSVTEDSASGPAHIVDAGSVGLAEHDGKVPVMAGRWLHLQSLAVLACIVPVHAIVVPEAEKLLIVVARLRSEPISQRERVASWKFE